MEAARAGSALGVNSVAPLRRLNPPQQNTLEFGRSSRVEAFRTVNACQAEAHMQQLGISECAQVT